MHREADARRTSRLDDLAEGVPERGRIAVESQAEPEAQVDRPDVQSGDPGDVRDRCHVLHAPPVLDHRIHARSDRRDVRRLGPHPVALAAVAAHALGLVARQRDRALDEPHRRRHRDDDAGRAVVEHARDERKVDLRDAHEHGDPERVEQLDPAERRAEVPGPVLEVEADPVRPRRRGRLEDEWLGHRGPEPDPERRSAHQKSASGFTALPVPPGIRSGATTSAKVERPSSRQAFASVSTSGQSRMQRPIATSPIWWSGIATRA